MFQERDPFQSPGWCVTFAQLHPVVTSGVHFTNATPWPPTPLCLSTSLQSHKTHFALKRWSSLYGWASQSIVKESQRAIPKSAQVTDPRCTPQGYISYSSPRRGLQKNQVMAFTARKGSSIMAQDALFLSISQRSPIGFHYTWQTTQSQQDGLAWGHSNARVSVPRCL